MMIRTATMSFLVGIAAWIAVTNVDAQQETTNQADAKLYALLVAKRDSLKERFDLITAMNSDGKMTYDAMMEAHELLLQAELELASTSKQRLDIHDKRLKNFRDLEERAALRVRLGTSNLAPKLLTTANRIQAEIDVQEERANSK